MKFSSCNPAVDMYFWVFRQFLHFLCDNINSALPWYLHLDPLNNTFLPSQVAVSTVFEDEKEFLNHIVKATNMKCLTPP